MAVKDIGGFSLVCQKPRDFAQGTMEKGGRRNCFRFENNPWKEKKKNKLLWLSRDHMVAVHGVVSDYLALRAWKSRRNATVPGTNHAVTSEVDLFSLGMCLFLACERSIMDICNAPGPIKRGMCPSCWAVSLLQRVKRGVVDPEFPGPPPAWNQSRRSKPPPTNRCNSPT